MTRSMTFLRLVCGAAAFSIGVSSASAATFALRAVKVNGVGIAETSTLNAMPGDEIEVEVRVFDFADQLNSLGGARAYQATVDGRLGVVSGPNPSGLILPKGWDAPLDPVGCCDGGIPDNANCAFALGLQCSAETCTCVGNNHDPSLGGFLDAQDPGFIHFGENAESDIGVAGLNYTYFSVVFDSAGTLDPGGDTEFYGGTLILVVEDFACGTFTFQVNEALNVSFLADPLLANTFGPDPSIPLTINLTSCPPIKQVSDPPHCAIDARRNHPALSTSPAQGLMSALWTFDTSTAGMGTSDFALRVVPVAQPPGPLSLLSMGNDLQITFARVIDTNRWTCVRHIDSDRENCYGFLPGDVDQSAVTDIADIAALIDIIRQTNITAPLYECDTDHSGRCGPLDLLELMNLMNGAEAHAEWLNATINALCPMR